MPSSLIRQDVLPVGVGYLLIMGALAVGLHVARRGGDPAVAERGPAPGAGAAGPSAEAAPAPARGPAGGPAAAGRLPSVAGWGRLARHYAGTAIGGYVLLMAVVILYYYGVARVGGAFIKSAFTGCALLVGLSAPVFALASWLTERWRGRGRAGSDRDPPAPQITR